MIYSSQSWKKWEPFKLVPACSLEIKKKILKILKFARKMCKVAEDCAKIVGS